jgi:hypothetical protein
MEATGSETTVTDSASGVAVTHGTRGNWGGLIILGKAPVQGVSPNVEGLAHDVPYGGADASDSSGTLQYVRVWHGGAAISADNEINGITFGGVGSGTTVDHCEVALNVDDGFEFFGGTVNAKYLSTLFVGDDAFDTDKGYQGKMQYLLAMLGTQGHHVAEMDGNKASDRTTGVESAPQVMSLTGIASEDNLSSDYMMRLREGTAGLFGNMLLYKRGVPGIRNDQCYGMPGTQTLPDYAAFVANALFVSAKTIMFDSTAITEFNDSCQGDDQLTTATTSSASVFTAMASNPSENNKAADSVDFTPVGEAVNAANVEGPFSSFFDTVDYSGAFAPTGDSWLDGWSYLDCVQV